MAEPTKTLHSLLRLHLADGVGAITIGKLLEHFGDAEAVCAAPAR